MKKRKTFNMRGGVTLLKGSNKSRADLARYFGVHSGTINNWVGAGMIPPPSLKIASRSFWTNDEFEQAIANIEKIMRGEA